LLVLGVIFLAAVPAPAAEVIDGWTVATRADNLAVFNRPRKGSSLLEYKGVGLIDAAPIVVKRVIDDTAEYPSFMPYVAETRTISRSGDIRVGYQRLSPPFVGDRDYTVRIKCETRPAPNGGVCYCNRWEAANELGPAEKKGVTRVKITEGYWLLEPTADGRQTKATYCIYSDSGGALPAMILNAANKTAIPKLFDSVRKQAKLEKYSRKDL
jgi:hypothetical protein